MPKGALLHAHLDATVNAEVLLSLALQYPCIHVSTPAKLAPSNWESVPPEFKPFPKAYSTTATSLTDDDYTPGDFVPILKARETFSSCIGVGGPQGFDQWVVDSLMIRPSEAYDQFDTSTKVTLPRHLKCRRNILTWQLDLAQV